MHNARIAEWILGLATTRDRAESIAGDLTEAAAAGRAIRFWSKVLRTANSLLWHDVAEHPARLIMLALVGLTIYIAIELLFAGLDGVAFFLAASRSGNHLQLNSIGWRIWAAAPLLIGSLSIGWISARWAPGRELAACVVDAAFVSIYNLVPELGGNGVLHAAFCVLLVPVGAACGCRRSAKHPRITSV